MNFHFINPGILWGMFACTIPIIIHLFFRRRYHRLPWAAMKFLLAAYRRTKTSIILENIILLLLRIAILFLLVLVFARPAAPEVSRITLKRTPIHHIVVLDNSYSMEYRQTNSSLFENAKEYARSLLAEAGEKDTVTLIAMNERVQTVFSAEEVPSNRREREAIFQTLEKIQVSEMGLNLVLLSDHLQQRLLRDRSQKELTIITDFQKVSWQKAFENPGFIENLQLIRDNVAAFHLIDVGSFQNENLAITDLSVDGVPGVGVPARFVATVRNFGARDYKNDVELSFYPQPASKYLFSLATGASLARESLNGNKIPENLLAEFRNNDRALSSRASVQIQSAGAQWMVADGEIDYFLEQEGETLKIYEYRREQTETQEGRQSRRISIGPGEKKEFEFFYTFDREEIGNRYVRVELASDFLATDNRRFHSFEVFEKIKVLAIDGDPGRKKFEGETDYLAAACGDVSSGLIHIEVVNLGQIGEVQFQDYNVVVIANLQSFSGQEQIHRLEEYVKKGGSVLFCLGDRVVPDYYNQEMFQDGMGILPGKILGDPVGRIDPGPKRTSFYLRDIATGHIVWRYFSINAPLRESLESALVYRFFPMEFEAKDSTVSVLAYYDHPQKLPAIIERKFGRGKVMVWTTTLDPDWNSLHTDQFGHVFVTMVHEFLQYLGTPPNSSNMRVGETLFRRYDREIKSASLTPPGRESVPLIVGNVDEYLFSLREDRGNRELSAGLIKLGLFQEGETMSLSRLSPTRWEAKNDTGRIYRIEHDEARQEADIFLSGEKNPIWTGLKTRPDLTYPEVVHIYRIDDKSYTVESRSSDIPKSGIYTLDLIFSAAGLDRSNRGSASIEYLAVNVDAAEGDLTTLPEAEIRDHLGKIRGEIEYSRHLNPTANPNRGGNRDEYWQIAMYILLRLLALETFLAMWFARRPR